MPTIEQILTAEEMQHLAEPNELEQVFGAMHIFGFGNFRMIGPVILVGDELDRGYRKILPRGNEPSRLLDNLPLCRQDSVGSLFFYALTGNRRLVVFHPGRGYERRIPHGYVMPSNDPKSNFGFEIREFAHRRNMDPEFLFEVFMSITPVIPVGKKDTVSRIFFDQGYSGALTWSTSRDNGGAIGFEDAQWKLVWGMLNNWVMK